MKQGNLQIVYRSYKNEDIIVPLEISDDQQNMIVPNDVLFSVEKEWYIFKFT